MSKVFYGVYYPGRCVDVTELALEHCTVDGELIIPIVDQNRADIFGDPFVGEWKSIFIVEVDGTVYTFDHCTPINIPQFE